MKHFAETIRSDRIMLLWNPKDERFRILAFHQKGGLGKVSVALDTELGRKVAFKAMRDDPQTCSPTRTFLLEG